MCVYSLWHVHVYAKDETRTVSLFDYNHDTNTNFGTEKFLHYDEYVTATYLLVQNNIMPLPKTNVLKEKCCSNEITFSINSIKRVFSNELFLKLHLVPPLN